jgi:hypothetical protein
MATTQTERIRALNDDLRQQLIGGRAVITLGQRRRWPDRRMI